MLTNEELKVAKIKYQNQAGHCRGRIDRLGNPIEFRLTFDQWLDIWLTSGHWHERGCRKGQYVMARFNDTGHYEVGNVEIKTHSGNIIENNNSAEWQSQHRAALKKMHNDPAFQEKRLAALKKMHNDPAFQEKRKAAIQKAHNKQISCDGVIYESRITAALALAPETRLTHDSKESWFEGQMKKYPERYFYI